MKVLGTYLRDKRKSLNLSIQDVADKLNLAYSTVANMETGTKNPTLEQLKAYGLIFGCEWIDILDKILNLLRDHSEFVEFEQYYKDINKEYEMERSNEDLKIDNSIDLSINIITERLIKNKELIDKSKVSNLREGIKMLIKNQAKYLKS